MDNRRDEPNLKLINMEQVEVEKIDWLLYPFIPFGKVTIVQGDPGEGKTTMVLQIIAKLTKGEAVLPSGSDEPALEEKIMDLEPVNVIYQTAEDGLGDTIKPRLLSAGADCSRVMVIDDNDQALTIDCSLDLLLSVMNSERKQLEELIFALIFEIIFKMFFCRIVKGRRKAKTEGVIFFFLRFW